MIKTMTIDGISLSDYQCFYSSSDLWRKPERMTDAFSVPGRNGDLFISQNKFSNVTRSFDCHIRENWNANYSALMGILSSRDGYLRIETTEEPDVYMMGAFTSEIEPDMWQFNRRGTFTLEFNFKPQKWLKTGENRIYVDSSATLLNPTQFASKPLIEVSGTGSMLINGSTLTLARNTGTTIIDCDLQEAYEGTINRNGDLTILNGFPVLKSGTNEVSVNGCTINIIPRWWRI